MLRYARKDRRVYQFSLCRVCGSAGGCGPTGCTTMVCLWCGTPQCSSNGLASGHCSVCYYGFLPGWSRCHAGQPCQYTGCQEPAVGNRFPRKGRVCASHAARILGADYLTKRLADREQAWEPVDVLS